MVSLEQLWIKISTLRDGCCRFASEVGVLGITMVCNSLASVQVLKFGLMTPCLPNVASCRPLRQQDA